MLLLTDRDRENNSEVWKTGATAQSRCGQTQTLTNELTDIKYPPPPPPVIRGIISTYINMAHTVNLQSQMKINQRIEREAMKPVVVQLLKNSPPASRGRSDLFFFQLNVI